MARRDPINIVLSARAVRAIMDSPPFMDAKAKLMTAAFYQIAELLKDKLTQVHVDRELQKHFHAAGQKGGWLDTYVSAGVWRLVEERVAKVFEEQIQKRLGQLIQEKLDANMKNMELLLNASNNSLLAQGLQRMAAEAITKHFASLGIKTAGN